MTKAGKTKRTEREMLDLLRRRYSASSGNGAEYALVEHVRNDAGFSATRTLDAVAMSLWPSRGLRIHGLEIKCSRADFIKELREPAKSEAFIPYLDAFWLVVGDREIVKAGELPETWGLLYAHGNALRCEKEAPQLHDGQPRKMDRGMLAALLRQAAVASKSEPELAEARRQGLERGREELREELRYTAERVQGREDKANAMTRTLNEILGFGALQKIESADEEMRAALRAALDGSSDLRYLQGRLSDLVRETERLHASATRAAEKHGAGSVQPHE